MVRDFKSADPSSVVRKLDDMSVAVCGVVDTAELCRNTHPDPSWVAAADGAYVQVQTLLAVRWQVTPEASSSLWIGAYQCQQDKHVETQATDRIPCVPGA